MGPFDLSLGDPTANTNFIYDACAGEYRYKRWLTCRLLDATGGLARVQNVDACVSDTVIFQPMASPFPVFHCGNQGLQHDWANLLPGTTSCMAMDVTDQAAGNYTLQIEVNPARRFTESSYSNNVIEVPVSIVPCHSVTPASRSFTDSPNGNNNGAPDPGEIIYEWVALSNAGCSASGISSTITSLTPGVTILQGASAYPDIADGLTESNTSPFAYRIPKSMACGSVVTLRQVIATSRAVFTSTWTRAVGTLQPLAWFTNTFDFPTGVRIPDYDMSMATATVNAAGITVIDDVNVSLRVDHPSIMDLIVTLVSPWSNTVVLGMNFTTNGPNYGSGNNCNTATRTVFDDEASTAFTNGLPPYAGSYRPVEPLSSLDGKPVTGAWILVYEDVETLYGGTARCASIRFSYHTAQYTCSTYQSAPTASNISRVVSHTATNLQLVGFDADGDTLRYRTNSAPAHGVLSGFNTNTGVITYTPAAGYVGADSFTFSVTDGTTTTAPATVSLSVGDIDQDGLPDAWESRYFPSPAASGPTQDPDGDGVKNWAEYVADSVPTNSQSVLPAITNLRIGATCSIHLNWSSTGRLYEAWLCSNLAGGVWVPVVTGQPGSGAALELALTNAPPTAAHRVRIRLP